MEAVDRNGLTEAEFLAAYKRKDYPRPSLTADIVAFSRYGDALRLLLIRRGGHPFLGHWALPGGFVSEGENAKTAAERELLEETHLGGELLYPVGLYSNPQRDPRGWTVSEAYLVVCESECDISAGDDAQDARWFTVHDESDAVMHRLRLQNDDDELTIAVTAERMTYGAACAHVFQSSGFAFDHACIVADAYLLLLGL